MALSNMTILVLILVVLALSFALTMIVIDQSTIYHPPAVNTSTSTVKLNIIAPPNNTGNDSGNITASG